jgi:CRP/FNR family transcriptional regulator, nitrogen oxide reductase regulator
MGHLMPTAVMPAAAKRNATPVRMLDPAVIRPIKLFRGLSATALTDIASAARPHRLSPGDRAFRQGDAPEAILLVLSGHFKAVQVTPEGSQIVARLAGPGDLIGHVAAFNDRPHPATPIAVVECLVIAWAPESFEDLMERYPQLALAVVRSMASSIQEAHTRLREASTERVEQRIAHAVLRLARQAGRRIDAGVEISFPLTRQDIALMAGATLHTVSRTISAWEQQGIVDGGRQHLIVSDPQALVRIAKGGPDESPE